MCPFWTYLDEAPTKESMSSYTNNSPSYSKNCTYCNPNYGWNSKFSRNSSRNSTSYHSPTLQFQMDPPLIQALIAQGIATAFAIYEASWNESSVNSGNGGDTPVSNRNKPRSYSYKDVFAYKSQSLFGTKWVFSVSRWMEVIGVVFHISSCTDNFGLSMLLVY